MVERRDHLDVAPPGERQDEVARPKLRVATTVLKRCAEVGTDPLHDVGELSGVTGVGHVIKPHGLNTVKPPNLCRTDPRH